MLSIRSWCVHWLVSTPRAQEQINSQVSQRQTNKCGAKDTARKSYRRPAPAPSIDAICAEPQPQKDPLCNYPGACFAFEIYANEARKTFPNNSFRRHTINDRTGENYKLFRLIKAESVRSESEREQRHQVAICAWLALIRFASNCRTQTKEAPSESEPTWIFMFLHKHGQHELFICVCIRWSMDFGNTFRIFLIRIHTQSSSVCLRPMCTRTASFSLPLWRSFAYKYLQKYQRRRRRHGSTV